jgi:hypothetical protein
MMDAVRITSTCAARIRAAHVAVLALATALTAACAPAGDSAERRDHATRPPVRIVDSILPVEEALRRFQQHLTRPAALTGGAPSREALVRRFVERLARRDTAGLRALTMTREEFAFLVYPRSTYTRPPYRTPPGLVWLQVEQDGATGLRRLFRTDLQVASYLSHRCAGAPAADGDVTLWRQCSVRVRLTGGDILEGRLFGVILERNGQFKFVNYHTDF